MDLPSWFSKICMNEISMRNWSMPFFTSNAFFQLSLSIVYEFNEFSFKSGLGIA